MTFATILAYFISITPFIHSIAMCSSKIHPCRQFLFLLSCNFFLCTNQPNSGQQVGTFDISSVNLELYKLIENLLIARFARRYKAIFDSSSKQSPRSIPFKGIILKYCKRKYVPLFASGISNINNKMFLNSHQKPRKYYLQKQVR